MQILQGTIALKKATRHNGFVPGVYLERLINKHWMVGLEYSHSIYKKKGYYSANSKINVKPSSNDFKIRFGYKF